MIGDLEIIQEIKLGTDRPYRTKHKWKVDFDWENIYDWFTDHDVLLVRFKREDKEYTQFVCDAYSESAVPIRTTVSSIDEFNDLVVLEKELSVV